MAKLLAFHRQEWLAAKTIAVVQTNDVLQGFGNRGTINANPPKPLPDSFAVLTREALPGQIRQSVSYFERAVAIDPTYADAWGALALTYSHLLQGYDPAELDSLPGRIRAAAQRSLELYP